MRAIADKDVKFLLKDPDATQPTSIRLFFRFNNQRLVYAIGKNILPIQWDKTAQRAVANHKMKRDRLPFEEINNCIGDHIRMLKVVWNRFVLAGTEPSVDELRQQLDKAMGKATVVKPKEKEKFLPFIERFVEEAKEGKRLTALNKRYSIATVKDYTKLLNHLKAYEPVIRKPINYDTITLTFYNKYKNHLTRQGYALNTVGALFKNLKILLKQAYREGLHENMVFEHEDFKKFQEETDSIYLSMDELNMVYTLDLTDKPRLDRVRDIFLVGCYTGLRWSDFSQLKPENITDKGRLLTVMTQKTGARVSIPIHPNVLAILAKYENTLPKAISNQKFNVYLKEIAKLAKLTEKVQSTKTKGGLKTITTHEKWELVKTHTARRSFATNAYLMEVPTISIMKLTGHKTETSFMRYIKVTQEETARQLLDHPFFTGQSQSTERKSVFTKVA